MSWKDEDEYEEEGSGSDNGFGTVANSNQLPEPVMVRIKAYAERTNKSVDKVKEEYLEYIKVNYGCDDYIGEEEELLIDWAESLFVETRRFSGGSNSNLSTWVGHFIGLHDRTKDRLTNLLRSNLKLYDEDPNEAVGSGRIAVFSKTGDHWSIHHKNNTTKLEASSAEDPPHGIKHGDDWLCMTNYSGQPAPSKKMGRYAYFLGGEEKDFVNNGSIGLWRVDLTGEAVDLDIDIGRACKIPVTPPKENAREAFKDVLGVYSNFEINYTDEFVGESLRPLLTGAKYWTSVDHDLFVPIDALEEAYEERKESGTINGERRQWGPLLITKGTITRMSTEPRDSEWDSEGFNYSMTLSSTICGDITCWIPGAVGMHTDPFTCGFGEDGFQYAEKSTVFVFARVGLKTVDGLVTPKLTVYGIHADPRRARRRAEGGDTGVEQFRGE